MASQQVHPTAIVHANAQIGKDVEIGPYAIIEEHVVIGDRCRIDAHAVIKDYTRMGVGNHIHSHALVGGEPQDLKFQGEVTWLELGDDNRIREFATLHRGTEGGGGITRIGSRNPCMAYTHIIGGLSAVHQFGHVGTHAFVGGMTGVAQDLPPWMLAAGSRALVHGPNLVGLRRAGASRETISAFKQAFRLIWRSEMPRSEALDLLANDYANLPQVMEFVDFVRSSERGLCPAEKNVEKKLDDNAV